MGGVTAGTDPFTLLAKHHSACTVPLPVMWKRMVVNLQ